MMRHFFLEGYSFADMADDDLRLTVEPINNRPCKRLKMLVTAKVLAVNCAVLPPPIGAFFSVINQNQSKGGIKTVPPG